MTKTDIIRDGLRLNFERHFCQSEKIILTRYQVRSAIFPSDLDYHFNSD